MKLHTLGILAYSALLSLSVAAETCTVFISEDTEQDIIKQQITPLLAPETECRFEKLPTSAISIAHAELMAKAIRYDIRELPTVQMADEEGIFATIPLRLLTPETLETARHSEAKAKHRQTAADNDFTASQFLLFTCMKLETPLTELSLEHYIADCRALMQHEKATDADRQRLGFLCLYPMLMQQYTNGYKGCHTPASEAKLLEAITALEAARDIDDTTTLGRKAYHERERLRKARREARKYE